MIPTDYQMIWVEIYKGIPGRPKTKSIASGWCAMPKYELEINAIKRISEHFHTQYPKNKYCVLCYPEDRCAQKFKASDRIFGIFS